MATCYRHPQRETNVSCSNCGRPICPDCMTSTPVGMRCPECARQRTRVKNPIGVPTRADAPATYVIMALCIAAYVAELAGGGTSGLDGGGKLIRDYGLFGPAVADGEQYRIVTSAFLHAGLIHLGLNMFVLYILGTLLEPAVGTARFVAIYAASILGGSFVALLLDPNELTVGASGGIFGLMGAAVVVLRNRGVNPMESGLLFWIGLNLVLTFSLSNISIGGHIGGLLGGTLAALVLYELPAMARVPQVTANVLCAALGVVSIVGAIAVA
jgi:membrane associated rhomboid family serine protease